MGSLFRSLVLGLALSVLPLGPFIFNGLGLRERDSGSNILRVAQQAGAFGELEVTKIDSRACLLYTSDAADE